MNTDHVTLPAFLAAVSAFFIFVPGAVALESIELTTQWQSPPEELLDVLHAPRLPWVWTAPTGEYLLFADPVVYPPLA
ncbi:MAG: hypothetical protein KAH31_10725, partial [Candidatus Sabulitectum sp.]|nr:hypothetical protein [Candidatus Sabulitectum sp.]